MRSMVERKVFEPVYWQADMRTVNCRMLVGPKDDGYKGRFVARGFLQNPNVYRETNSPTVSIEVVHFALAIMAEEGRHARVIDIVSAYLEAHPILSNLSVGFRSNCYKCNNFSRII